MENQLEQFRQNSIPIITRHEQWNDGKGFDLEKLRYQFLENNSLITEEQKSRVYDLLFNIQTNLGDQKESMLSRFKAVSHILIIVIIDKQLLEKELTEAANRYLKGFRTIMIGAVSAGGDIHQEAEIQEFYFKLIETQRELLFGKTVGI